VILMIAYPVRFAPSYLQLRANVESGRLGDVFAVLGTNNGKIPYAARQWFTDAKLAGGGAMVDHTVHCADLIDGLTGGASATRVYAASNRILHQDKGVEVETGGLVTINYDNGLLATIDFSWSVPDNGPTWGGVSLQVTGTNGSVEIEPFLPHVGGTDASGEVFLGIGGNLDESMLDTFLDAVRTAGPAVAGQPPAVVPQPDGAVGLRTLRIVDAARRSAASGQAVDL
jgi:predicted dehydrogenase